MPAFEALKSFKFLSVMQLRCNPTPLNGEMEEICAWRKWLISEYGLSCTKI
jgi:hypothetical protein